MSLELKISAGNAKATLDDITAAANRLKSALDSLPQATRFNNLVKSLNSFTGIPPSAINDIDKLGSAINKLASARDLSTIAKGLNSLGRVDMAKVATNVERLSAALRGFVVPTGLVQAAAMLDRFGKSAQAASVSTRGLTASLRGLKVPTGLSSATGSINKLANSFSAAQSGAMSFGGALSNVNGLLAGFGVTIGAVGFGRFISGLNDAEKQMASFRAITDNMMGDAGGASASLDMLRDTAYKLGLPLRELVDTYPKFSAALRSSGQDAGATNKIYKDLSVALAGVGADAIKTQRVFKAVEQMFNKGSVTAEELKQQLGDAIPGAVSIFAQSMGLGTQELLKMMEAGNVASSNVGKFAEALASRYGPAAEAMAQTWIGASNRMSSAWFDLQTAMSNDFFKAITPSVNSFTDALKGFVDSGAASSLATSMGIIASGVIEVGAAIVNLMGGPLGGIVSVFAGVAAGALALGGAFKTVSMAAGVLGVSSIIPLITGLGNLAMAAAGAVASFAMMHPILLGIGVAIAAAVVAYNALSGSTETAAQAADRLYQSAGQVSGEVDTMGEAMHVAANASNDWGVSTTMLAQAQQVLAAEIGVIQGLIANYNEQLKAGTLTAQEHAQKMEELAARMDKVQEAMTNVARGAEKHRSAMDGAANATNSAASASDRASGNFSRMGSSMSSATSQARSLDAALQSLASTQRQVESSTTSVTSRSDSEMSDSSYRDTGPIGFEGQMFDSGSLFSGGGISHKGTNNKWRNLPAALWKGAPRLAGGIANTNEILGAGGIPAVLHPNEAVVPLTGGGSIPIAGDVGGGAGMQVVAGAISQLISVNMGTKTEVTRVKEAVNANTSVLKNAIDKVNMTLMAVSSGVTALRGSGLGGGAGGAGGSSSGGGGTLGFGGGTPSGGIGSAGALAGGVGGSGALFEFAQQANSLSNAVSQANDRVQSIYDNAPYFQYGTGGSGARIMLNPGDRQSYADAKNSASYASAAYMDYLWSNPTLAAAYYREKARNSNGPMRDRFNAYAEIFDSGRRQPLTMSGAANFVSGFATGSPNASKDASGGFMAKLHPDEAVIPLPDGRTVPVQLPEQLSSLMTQMEREYRGSDRSTVVERSRSRSGGSVSAGGGGGGPINIQMYIETPDAASFSKSKAQIMQEFKSEFDRVAQRYGSADRREDPTRRTKR